MKVSEGSTCPKKRGKWRSFICHGFALWWNWYLHLHLTTHQHIFRPTTNGPETLPISSMQPISLDGKCISRHAIMIAEKTSQIFNHHLGWPASFQKSENESDMDGRVHKRTIKVAQIFRRSSYRHTLQETSVSHLGKKKSSTQKCLAKRICQFPGGYIVSGVLYASSRKWNFERIHYRNRPLMGGRATWHSVSTYLSAYLSVYLCVYLSTCLAIYLPVYLFAYLSTHLYIVFNSLSI